MRALVVLVALCPACGDSSNPATDGAMPPDPDASLVDAGPCWPELDHVATGSADVGEGQEAFEAMPATLPIHYGSQNGFHVYLNARMSGFAPGDSVDYTNPDNLRTRVAVYFDDSNIRLNSFESSRCPARLGYVPASGGGFEFQLVHGLTYIFDSCWRSDHLTGTRLRVELEVMDNNGGYAKDTKVVIGGEPDFIPAMDTGTAGCPQVNGAPYKPSSSFL